MDVHGLLHGAGWPEIENPGFPIQIPLTGRIDLLEQIERIVRFALADSVPVRLNERDLFLLGVDGLDTDVLIGPVVEPIAEQPEIVGLRPTIGPVALIDETSATRGFVRRRVRLAIVDHLARLDHRVVGPTSQGHRPTAEEELQFRRQNRFSKPTGFEFSVVGDAMLGQSRLQKGFVRAGIDTAQNRGIGYTGESGDRSSARKTDLFITVVSVDDF